MYSSTIAALFILGFFILQQINQQKELVTFNESFSTLTALNLEEELLSMDDSSVDSIFDDEEELNFIVVELQKPSKRITLYNEDFENFFESEIEYIY